MADLAASSTLLAALRDDFPAFRISREIIGDRIQYVVRRRDPGTHPHTVVTADPAGLRSALATATCRGRTLARLAAALPEQPAAMTLLMAATEDWPLNSPAARPGR
jgi:hypothetical protein